MRNTLVSEALFDKWFYPVDKGFCISLLVSTCPVCSIQILFIDGNETPKWSKTIQPTNGTWVHHRIVMDNADIQYMKVKIKTMMTQNWVMTGEEFWSFDDLRDCHKEEYRITQRIPKKISECRLLTNNQRVKKEKVIEYVPDSSCLSTNSIGRLCFPCSVLVQRDGLQCKNLKICEDVEDTNKCYCSPGYNGTECNEVCPDGTYGYSCGKRCGFCYTSGKCDTTTGSCICNAYFEGSTCDTPKYGQFLRNAPKIVNITANSCQIKWNFTDWIGKVEPKYYQIQYMKESTTSNPRWLNYGLENQIEIYDTAVIENLDASQKYKIRVLISDRKDYIRYLSSQNLPFTICQTTCNDWKDVDIEINTTSTSAIIQLNATKDKCDVELYKYQLKNEKGETILMGSARESIIIKNLTIYANYTFKFFSGAKIITRKFSTQQGAPSEVRDIVMEESTASYIKLRWEEPELANGVIEKYKVVYRKLRRISCISNSTEKSAEMNTTDKSIHLNNLEPYSIYGVKIFAFNRFYSSKQANDIIMETRGLNYFEKDEDLESTDVAVKTSEMSASIEFKNVQCKKLKGPLIFAIEYRCISKWCSNMKNRFESFSSFDGTLRELQPYCEYKFDILFCRNETNCEKNEKYNNRTFTTKASVPNQLTEISVIAAGDTFISLRWLPPYPPSGTIGKYKFITRCTSCGQFYENEKTTLIELAKNCPIWPEYKCHKITTGIKPGGKYSIEILAYNMENKKFQRIASLLDVPVYETAPDKPYNLSAIWNPNNTMELFWNHPNKTNGILHGFRIQVTPNYGAPVEFTHLVTSINETLTYSYTISNPLPSSVDLSIRISTVNTHHDSEPAEIYESSFPAKPDLSRFQISITNYTETTISLNLDVTQIRVSNVLVEQSAFLLIDDYAYDVKDPKLVQIEKKINSTFVEKSRLRVVFVFDLKTLPTTIINFTIGDESGNGENKPLQKATYYNITIVLLNGYKKKYRHTSQEIRGLTEGNPDMTTPSPTERKGEEDNSGGSAAYALLLLLLLIPIIIVVVIKRKHIVFVRPTISLEKILDSSSRMLPSAKENDENILLETKETVVIANKPVMKVKPKLSIRKSTNPPNVPTNVYSKPVAMADFEEYVKTSIESGELERQHALFPRGQTQSWHYGSTKVNKPKNRYNNLVAYDHSRVILEKLPGDENSDYINANYIHGYNIERAYIATQGPKPTTLTDFWRMIWQENVRHIVMVANILEGGKKKVEQYWPNINEELTFQDIIVQYQSMEVFANFEYRIFHATKGEETRKISQLHFTSWPDHGVPLYPQSLVAFLRKLLKIQLSSSSPVVVHCSAGVGRTGTVLLADMSLRMAAKQGVVDILNNIQKLREQRPNMVDNVEQYKLAHLVVLESLMGLRTSIPCNEDIDKAVQKLIMDEDYRIQMNYLRETEWQDQAMKSMAESEEEYPIFTEKNRIQEIIPENQGRLFLSRYPPDDESSSYINAVQVDGFRIPGRYFVTQQPMPNTLGDFWRFVTERKINVILSLNDIDLKEKTCCKFWPTADDPELRPVDFVLVKFGEVTELEYYNIYSLHVWIKKRETEKQNVEIVAFKGWQAKTAVPSSCEEFLSFYEEADAVSRRSTNVIVTCFDGATACGVYVALSFIIEQMKLEHECDVCLAVRSIRHNRKQFITDEVQFLFLYECAVKFINGFQSYANFQNQ